MSHLHWSTCIKWIHYFPSCETFILISHLHSTSPPRCSRSCPAESRSLCSSISLTSSHNVAKSSFFFLFLISFIVATIDLTEEQTRVWKIRKNIFSLSFTYSQNREIWNLKKRIRGGSDWQASVYFNWALRLGLYESVAICNYRGNNWKKKNIVYQDCGKKSNKNNGWQFCLTLSL